MFNADGSFTGTHSFINYFSIPSIGLKLSNTAQTLNSKHTRPSVAGLQLGDGNYVGLQLGDGNYSL